MFLCREAELAKLERRYQNDGSEFIVIYGRRRVGKTALIHAFTRDKPAIYFPALQANARANLAALSRAIEAYRNPGAVSAPVYSSFDAAFAEITRLAKHDRLIFVIDEFPYLARSDSSLPSVMQHLLDGDWSDSRLFLILCGSSMSFMEKEVLSEKSPLFGRRTAQFEVKPLTYRDTARFHPELTNEENALIYGITGGVPHYINKLHVTDSVRTALLDNFFDTSAYLFEEPGNLLKQELREPAIYNSIIIAIANGAARVNEIASGTALDLPTISRYLRVLMELGIVTKVTPVVGKTKRKVLYRITDNFFRFWYRFVPGNLLAISADNAAGIFDAAVGSYLPEYMGLVFEQMCHQYLIHYAEDLPFPLSQLGEWWGTDPQKKREAQVDIVGVAPRVSSASSGRHILIGSCKYRNEKIGIDELKLIQHYASLFTDGNDRCCYCIFSKSGFTEGLMEAQRAGEVVLVSLNDMY